MLVNLKSTDLWWTRTTGGEKNGFMDFALRSCGPAKDDSHTGPNGISNFFEGNKKKRNNNRFFLLVYQLPVSDRSSN